MFHPLKIISSNFEEGLSWLAHQARKVSQKNNKGKIFNICVYEHDYSDTIMLTNGSPPRHYSKTDAFKLMVYPNDDLFVYQRKSDKQTHTGEIPCY